MTKEFNLSELWEAFKSINENTDIQGVLNFESALKEFIGRILEEIDIQSDADGTLSKNELIEVITELAGDKLT